MGLESSKGASPMTNRMSIFQFDIDYTKSENVPAGEFIYSPIFTAGGYEWILQYYPQGDGSVNRSSYASVDLCLQSSYREITAEYSFQLRDKRGQFVTIHSPAVDKFTRKDVWGYAKFIPRDAVKNLYCLNGVLVISCSIRVCDKNSSPLCEMRNVQTYPGGLCEHIEKLWEKGERFDVTFEVEGESISAHRFMLATRSPVFEAELFGPMAEATMGHIKIDEMKAEVLKALIYFVYTDRLANDDSSDQESTPSVPSVELFQGLFAAADRYSLNKLTLMCEEKLERYISVDTVVATLLLADRHSRSRLKQKCLDFASRPENFSLIALTQEYVRIMHEASALLAELSEKVKCLFPFAKKQKNGQLIA